MSCFFHTVSVINRLLYFEKYNLFERNFTCNFTREYFKRFVFFSLKLYSLFKKYIKNETTNFNGK
jgi:hypothetical protein